MGNGPVVTEGTSVGCPVRRFSLVIDKVSCQQSSPCGKLNIISAHAWGLLCR